MNSDDVILEPVSINHFAEWSAILAPLKIAEASFKMFIDMTEHQQDNDIAYIYIVRKSDGEFIGSVNVFNIQRGSFQSAALDYKILEAFQGQGYGTKAVKALEDICFNTLKLKKLMAYVVPENKASERVLQKLGYELQYTDPNGYFDKNCKAVKTNVFVKIRN